VSVAVDVEQFIVREIVPDVGAVDHDQDLLASELIDSMGIMQLISFLEQKYGVKVGDEDLDPENFRTIDTIASFVESRKA
jgi:acyl carrier protein